MSEQEPKRKPWTRMTLAELREATKQYDLEIPLETKPLTEVERQEWEQMQRKPSNTIRRHRNRNH
jgi:hypothetical protein